jgi:hypothetical protein
MTAIVKFKKEDTPPGVYTFGFVWWAVGPRVICLRGDVSAFGEFICSFFCLPKKRIKKRAAKTQRSAGCWQASAQQP